MDRLSNRIKHLALLISMCILSLMLFIGCSGNNTKDNKSKSPDQTKKSAKQAGYDAYKKRDWDQAIENLKKAATESPKDINAKFRLAKSYENKNLNEEAIKQYEAVLKIDKNNADAHYKIGRILMKSNEIDKAITEFEKVIRSNKSFTSAYADLANTYTIKNDYVKALAVYETLEKTFKSDTKYLSHMHTLKGNVYKAMDDPVKAKVEYEEALKLDSSNDEATAGISSLGKQ